MWQTPTITKNPAPTNWSSVAQLFAFRYEIAEPESRTLVGASITNPLTS